MSILKTKKGLIELLTAVVISLAALATSFATYEARLWSGEQARVFGLAGAYRTISSRQALEADDAFSIEVGLFSAWADAEHLGDKKLASFYRSRFPPRLKKAFEEWLTQNPLLNPQAASSPFALTSYQQGRLAGAEEMEKKAAAQFNAGLRAIYVGNGFTQCAVIFAGAMFFAGISQVFQRRGVSLSMVAFAIIACAYGVMQIFSLPMRYLGQ
jgi:hypothetical protein